MGDIAILEIKDSLEDNSIFIYTQWGARFFPRIINPVILTAAVNNLGDLTLKYVLIFAINILAECKNPSKQLLGVPQRPFGGYEITFKNEYIADHPLITIDVSNETLTSTPYDSDGKKKVYTYDEFIKNAVPFWSKWAQGTEIPDSWKKPMKMRR